MTAKELIEKIHREIGDEWQRPNAHGVDLRKCLVPPSFVTMEDCTLNAGETDVWVVLQEDPVDAKVGYLIAYDESTDMFGLATFNNLEGRWVYLGANGTFLETLEAM